jgi:hypothetical protein
MDRNTYRQTDGKSDILMDRHMESQTYKWTDTIGQTDGKSDILMDRQKESQTY